MTVQQPALSGHCLGLKVDGGGTAGGTEGQGGGSGAGDRGDSGGGV